LLIKLNNNQARLTPGFFCLELMAIFFTIIERKRKWTQKKMRQVAKILSFKTQKYNAGLVAKICSLSPPGVVNANNHAQSKVSFICRYLYNL
tara:strand:+ start:227 stop:502 length:276 start_codon:yes stop_codon:yes gene_type:complete